MTSACRINDLMRHSMVKPVYGLLFISFGAVAVCGRVGYEVEVENQEEELCVDADKNEYRCAVGHCCGDANCCTHYYELWWFWVIWAAILILSCCCVYRHRAKRRNLHSRRNGTGNNSVYSAVCSYPGPPVDKGHLGFSKLPNYDDIVRIPPSGSPPPPYASSRMLNGLASVETNSDGVTMLNFLSYSDLTSSVISLANSLGFNFGRRQRAEQQVDDNGAPESIITSSASSLTSRGSNGASSRNSMETSSKQFIDCDYDERKIETNVIEISRAVCPQAACGGNMSMSKCSSRTDMSLEDSFEEAMVYGESSFEPSASYYVDVNNNSAVDDKSLHIGSGAKQIGKKP